MVPVYLPFKGGPFVYLVSSLDELGKTIWSKQKYLPFFCSLLEFPLWKTSGFRGQTVEVPELQKKALFCQYLIIPKRFWCNTPDFQLVQSSKNCLNHNSNPCYEKQLCSQRKFYLTKKHEGKLNTRKTSFIMAWDLGKGIKPGSTLQYYAPKSTCILEILNLVFSFP